MVCGSGSSLPCLSSFLWIFAVRFLTEYFFFISLSWKQVAHDEQDGGQGKLTAMEARVGPMQSRLDRLSDENERLAGQVAALTAEKDALNDRLVASDTRGGLQVGAGEGVGLLDWARRLVFCCVGLDWHLICPLISLALLTRSHPPPHPHPNQQLVSPRLNVRCEATWRTRRKHGQRRRRALAILLRKWRRSRRSSGRPTSKPPVSTLATTRHVGRTGGAWPINLVPHNPCTHTHSPLLAF